MHTETIETMSTSDLIIWHHQLTDAQGRTDLPRWADTETMRRMQRDAKAAIVAELARRAQ